ncbi:hypothetical protein [Geobacillus sp. YF-1]|uniref:hypothetical protein n=1 Tax=Geobacillus sp. YF-1 TaxID=3457480 RepID=UPI004046227D
MSKAGVWAKTCTYEELSALVERWRHDLLFTYVEMVDQLPQIQMGIQLPTSFLSLRIFGELFELYVKPGACPDQYRAVLITDRFDLIEGEYIPLTIGGQRSFFLDKSVLGGDRKLLIQYYESEQYGEFMRWKGVL